MADAAATQGGSNEDEPHRAQNEPKPCPVCGSIPRSVPGLFGGYYLACEQGHHETKVVSTREEAIRLWNAGQYEG